MEVDYYPFLKAKQSEILAVSRLSKQCLGKITPFFDLPCNTYKDNDVTIADKVTSTCQRIEKKKQFLVNGFFYDHFDLDPRIKCPGGRCP